MVDRQSPLVVRDGRNQVRPLLLLILIAFAAALCREIVGLLTLRCQCRLGVKTLWRRIALYEASELHMRVIVIHEGWALRLNVDGCFFRDPGQLPDGGDEDDLISERPEQYIRLLVAPHKDMHAVRALVAAGVNYVLDYCVKYLAQMMNENDQTDESDQYLRIIALDVAKIPEKLLLFNHHIDQIDVS